MPSTASISRSQVIIPEKNITKTSVVCELKAKNVGAPAEPAPSTWNMEGFVVHRLHTLAGSDAVGGSGGGGGRIFKMLDVQHSTAMIDQ